MTVAELRELLAGHPGDMEVMRDDDEGGPGDIYHAEVIRYPQYSDRFMKRCRVLGIPFEEPYDVLLLS